MSLDTSSAPQNLLKTSLFINATKCLLTSVILGQVKPKN